MSNTRLLAGILMLSVFGLAACDCGDAQGPPPSRIAGGDDLHNAATLAVWIDLDPDAAVTSPVRITGTADHRFFNEGVFPIRLLGANGCVLGEAPAMPTGDWMTPGQVAFQATLAFDAVPGPSAVLVFEQDVVGEDPLPPLQVRTLLKVAGSDQQADPDPQDCTAAVSD